MDGNLANAGAAEGATMEGADRHGESCQSQLPYGTGTVSAG